MYVPGWIDDPAAVLAVQSALPDPVYGNTAAAMEEAADEIFLWDAAKRVIGQHIEAHNQLSVGCCVGEGFSAAVEYLSCVEIAVGGEVEEFKRISSEVVYGLSRVEVGGSRIRGDGSVGAWAAKALTDYGCLPREKFGRYDFTQFSERTARELGANGLPDDLEPVAKLHICRAATQVSSFREALSALSSGYPVAVCSDQGFSMQRDRDGFCEARGTWNHCMCFIGGTKKGRAGLCCLQSWGPQTPSGPIGLGDHPTNAFWVEADVADRMLGQGDSWALSAFNGFPGRKLNWLI